MSASVFCSLAWLNSMMEPRTSVRHTAIPGRVLLFPPPPPPAIEISRTSKKLDILALLHSNDIQNIYCQTGYFMLDSLVNIASHPRQPLDFFSRLTPIPRPLPLNSHGIKSFTDPHPLTFLESYCFENSCGEGAFPAFRPWSVQAPSVFTFSPTLRLHKSFRCNAYGSLPKCCKQKAYGLAKSFRCNTYKKSGGASFKPSISRSLPLLDVRTFRRANVNAPIFRTHFQVSYLATSLFATLAKNRGGYSSHFGTPARSRRVNYRRGGRWGPEPGVHRSPR